MNKCYHCSQHKRLAIITLLIASLLSAIPSAVYIIIQPADAFKPNTHILTGNSAISSILVGSDAVTINNRIYPVDARITDAIRNFPDYYRGGLVGPDAFPEIYVGQSFIHPDTRCDNGLKPRDQCNNNSGHSFTYEWLRHVYDSAWDYYNIRNGDEEAKKALAIAYGFLTQQEIYRLIHW